MIICPHYQEISAIVCRILAEVTQIAIVQFFYANISKTEGEIVTDCVITMIIFTVCRSFTLTDSV